jgi:hypothetical protein
MVRIEISGGTLISPLQITDEQRLEEFVFWDGPGMNGAVLENAERGSIIDWKTGIVAQHPADLQRYEVSFYWMGWEQVDLHNQVIRLGGNVKTKDSEQPVPLTRLASDVLIEWKKECGSRSPFLFPSPSNPEKPIGNVRRTWKTTLKKAGVPYFPIYNLRHVFCTRLSWVAPDAVVQHAMRHSSPETERFYQLGLAQQVREHLEQVNEKTYEGGTLLRLDESSRDQSTQQSVPALEPKKAKSGRKSLRFRDSAVPEEKTQQIEACI